MYLVCHGIAVGIARQYPQDRLLPGRDTPLCFVWNPNNEL